MPKLLVRSVAAVAITLAIFAGTVVASGGPHAHGTADQRGSRGWRRRSPNQLPRRDAPAVGGPHHLDAPCHRERGHAARRPA